MTDWRTDGASQHIISSRMLRDYVCLMVVWRFWAFLAHCSCSGLTWITKQKKKSVKQRGKNENYQSIRAGFEQLTKGGCLSLPNHRLFYPHQCFQKLVSILTLRNITALMSCDLLNSHRRWLLLWVFAL